MKKIVIVSALVCGGVFGGAAATKLGLDHVESRARDEVRQEKEAATVSATLSASTPSLTMR